MFSNMREHLFLPVFSQFLDWILILEWDNMIPVHFHPTQTVLIWATKQGFCCHHPCRERPK